MTKKTLLSDSTQYSTYQYSSENQLVGISFYASGSSTPWKSVSYAYDGQGRRMSKSVNNTNAPTDPAQTFGRQYVYDGSEIRAEYDGSGDLLGVYTNSGLVPDDVLGVSVQPAGAPALAQNRGNYYYLKDQVGSVIEVIDSGNDDLQHYQYSAYGQLLSTSTNAISTSRTFTGRELDSESGLYYFRARYYDPASGRFLSRDPFGTRGGSPNRYSYARNNPLLYGDPLGLWTLQVGGYLAGGAGAGWTFSGGIAMGYSAADGLTFAWYGNGGTGSYIGHGGSGGVEFGASSNNNVSQLSGPSLDTGASFPILGGGVPGLGAVGGLTISVPLNNNAAPTSWLSLGVGGGTPISGSINVSNTYIGGQGAVVDPSAPAAPIPTAPISPPDAPPAPSPGDDGGDGGDDQPDLGPPTMGAPTLD